MKRSYIVLIILFVVFVAASFFAYTNRADITCKIFRDYPTGESNCYFDYAINQKKVKYCEKVVDDDAKARCHEYLALSLRDGGICSLIDPNVKFYEENYRNLCFLQLAYITGNVGSCSNIKNDQYNEGYCRLLVAIKNNDLAVCDDNYIHYYIYVNKIYGDKNIDYNVQGDDHGSQFDRTQFFDEGKSICLDIVTSGKFYPDRFSNFDAMFSKLGVS